MKYLKSVAGLGPLLIIGGYVYYSMTNWNIWVQVILYTGIALTLVTLGLNLGQIKASFGKRSTQYGTNTVVMTVIVIGILGMINFVGKRHHKRVDLTSAKLFSLSDQTEKIVKGLKTDVTIYHFAKETNPTVNDLLSEYKGVNQSKLSFKVIDPQKDPGLAKKFGVRSFGETVVASGEKHEKVDTAQEEAVTNALLKVTREKNKVIYFTQGHNEVDISSQEGRGYASAKKGIENQNYEVKTVNLATNPSIPADCSALIIAGPKVALLPTEASLIDKYVDAGGKLFLMQDPDTDAGLDELLKKWKIALDSDIVVDSSGLGQLFGMGPAAPLVTTYESHPITKELANGMTFFPLSRSVKTIDNSSSQFVSSLLFKTSESSWGEKNLKSGSAEYNEGVDVKGPVPLGAVSTKVVAGNEKEKRYGKEARVVVIGDSDFANNSYIRMQRNGDLFLNAVSWLAEDEDLISVRPKNQENRTVQMTEGRSMLLKWLSLIFLPGSILIMGIAVWVRRR
jgi:gliding motility-associatede transport system auxiliary component